MEQALNLRRMAAAILLFSAADGAFGGPAHVVEYHPTHTPKALWARELIWLHNIGISGIVCADAPAEFEALAARAGLALVMPGNSMRVSALAADALIESRRAILAHNSVRWTEVETEVAPEFRRGAVSVTGEEDAALQGLRREAAVDRFWGAVLASPAGPVEKAKLPDTLVIDQRQGSGAAALSIINSAKTAWHGELRAFLPSYRLTIQIPDVTVPGRDALLLPLDVPLSSPLYCRACSGMSNSERLLYATAELTAIEYENGILSFEFYAPQPGRAVLQLEREPNGPMLAGGRPTTFDWDPENKRAGLPIPAGKGAAKRSRIAIAISAPDDSAGFVDTRVMVIGETNRILTEYSSAEVAKRSRLVAPAGWKFTSEAKSPLQVSYAIQVPGDKLHGDRVDLRLETDGVGMSHVRVPLLRPVSVHIAEADALHFGNVTDLVSDPPIVPVEGPNGRNLTIQLRNNAPEIRNFHVDMAGENLEFSPAATDISIGATMEREISVRVFPSLTGAVLRGAHIHVSGAAIYDAPLAFAIVPRTGTSQYQADVTGTGQLATVLENSRLRAVFSRQDGGRWMDFYWKPSGKRLLPPNGIEVGGAVQIDMRGDELTFDGGMPPVPGGTFGSVVVKVNREGPKTTYSVSESVTK